MMSGRIPAQPLRAQRNSALACGRAEPQPSSAGSSWPKPASVSSRRAGGQSSSLTRMRRGKIPIEPSSTLMFRSTIKNSMSAPLSSASIAESTTALLVRTSSRKASAPPPFFARRAQRQISEQFRLSAAARHRIEDQAAGDRQEGEQHQSGREYRGRQTRHQALLHVGDD